MNAIPLSPVDYVFTGAGSQPITFAFAYPVRLAPEALQSSLTETLEAFPALRSRLSKASEDDYEYAIAGPALQVEVVESALSWQSSERIERFIRPVCSVVGQPLTRITLTQTPQGSVLAASISHALVDGFSYFHFLSSWARVCRGERFIQPCVERDVLSAYAYRSAKTVCAEDVYTACGLFYGGKRSSPRTEQMARERVVISAETIGRYLAEAKQQGVACSENDVLTALLWKTYIPLWNEQEGDPTTYVTCPVDFRRILPGFPRSYFGCALCFATAAIGLGDLARASLADLAALVRDAVSRCKKDYVLNSLNTFENLRKQHGPAGMEEVHLRHPANGMIVTNLTRMPIQDLDFGLGAPVRSLAYAEIGRSAAILPAENGVEVLVVCPPATVL